MKTSEKCHYDSVYLKHKYDTGKLKLDPDYQRYSVWKLKQRQLLIDSMIRGLDIPKIYLRVCDYECEVVDGAQRLRALFDYLNGDLSLPADFKDHAGHKISGKFEKLHGDLEKIINSYKFDIVELKGYTESEIGDYFGRLQSGSTLNRPERRRAIVSNMRNRAFEASQHQFFGLLKETNKRCKYEDYFGKVFHIVKHRFTSNPTAEKIDLDWWSYKNIEKTDVTIKDINNVFNFAAEALSNCKNSFGNYFLVSLFVSTYDLIKGTNIRNHKEEYAEAVENFYLSQSETEEQISIGNSEQCDKDLVRYFSYKKKDSLTAIGERSDVITNFIRKSIPSLCDKDPHRNFSSIQKANIYRRDKGTCQICGLEGNIDEFQVDHIIPFSDGGKTLLDNGQLLCINCNISKSNKIQENDKIINLINEVETPSKEYGKISISDLTN